MAMGGLFPVSVFGLRLAQFLSGFLRLRVSRKRPECTRGMLLKQSGTTDSVATAEVSWNACVVAKAAREHLVYALAKEEHDQLPL